MLVFLNHLSIKQLAIILVVFTFVLYGNTLKNKFAIDDEYVTVTNLNKPNNPRIAKGIKGIPKIFKSHYVEMEQQSFEYRPFVLATFAIEYQFFKGNPAISHFINVLLYALTGLMLFLTLTKLLKEYLVPFSFLITLVFLSHPLHTELVASLKSRDELLSFLFGITSLFFILKNTETQSRMYLLLSILSMILASLSKITYVFFIALIPLSLYFFTNHSYKKIFYFLGLLLIAIIVSKTLKASLLIDETKVREFAFFENPLFFETSLIMKIQATLNTLGFYLKLLFIPNSLNCYYGYNTITLFSWLTPFTIVSFIAYPVMIYFVVKTFFKKHIFSFAIITLMIGLLPFSNFKTPVVGIVGERFVYFSTFGYSILIVYLLSLLFKFNWRLNETVLMSKTNSRMIMSIILLVFVFSSFTISRNSEWKDELTLFRNDVKNNENSCNLHYILANKLYAESFKTTNPIEKEKIVNEAVYHYKAALELMKNGVIHYPSDYTTLNNIGTIYVNVFNDGESAQPFFKQSLKTKPTNEVTQFNYAFCFEKRNLPDSALKHYEQLIADSTSYGSVYVQARELFAQKQQYAKAIFCDKKAIASFANNPKLYINLGNDYLMNKDTLLCITPFEKAVALDWQNEQLKKQIVQFLLSIGQEDKAKKMQDF